jgi:hypothetical protein
MFKRTVPIMPCVRQRSCMGRICSLSESLMFVLPNPTGLAGLLDKESLIEYIGQKGRELC